MHLARLSVEPWIGLPPPSSAASIPPALLTASASGLWAAHRASCRYFLRALLAGADGSGGDILNAAIMTAIMDANIGHLDADPVFAWRYARYEQVPPDGFRRPITIRAVAARLGLPYETARRRIDRLMAVGRCAHAEGGVYAPTIYEPRHETSAVANRLAVRTLLRDLRINVPEIDWPIVAALDGGDATPPLRLINRRCAAFAVEVLPRLSTLCGGYDEALVYLGFVEATGRSGDGEPWPSLRMSPLARSLGLPVASVRRRTQALAIAGLVTSTPAGYCAQPSSSMQADVSGVATAILSRLHLLFVQLARLEASKA